MTNALKKIYKFLFHEHDIGFIRFCYGMLIPCVLSRVFCLWFMWFLSFVLILVIQANAKGWNREGESDAKH